MKVNLCFKAKKEAFRGRKSSKVGNVPFWLHLTPNFLERDETRFLCFPSRNLAQTNALAYISLDVIFYLLKISRLFTFIYKRNGFLIILEPFWALSQRYVRRTDRPSRPPPSRRKFSSRVRAPPPRSNEYRTHLLDFRRPPPESYTREGAGTSATTSG